MLQLGAQDNVLKTWTKWINIKSHLDYVSRHWVKRNTKKSRKLQKSVLLIQKLVTFLNLGYLVISVAPGNHKLICLFIYLFQLTVFMQFFQPVHLPELNFNIQNGRFFGIHLLEPCEKPDPKCLHCAQLKFFALILEKCHEPTSIQK